MGLIIGTVLGFLSGLGIGGGSLLILYLTMAAGLDQTTARGVNLLFYLPCAALACGLRWKQGSVNAKKILPAILAGCAAAAAFSWLSPRLDVEILKKWFGGLLVVTGLREIFHRPGKK